MARLGEDACAMECCAVVLWALWLSAAALMKSGLGRDAPLSGESSAMEGARAFPSLKTEHLHQLYPSEASGCSIPASLCGT